MADDIGKMQLVQSAFTIADRVIAGIRHAPGPTQDAWASVRSPMSLIRWRALRVRPSAKIATLHHELFGTARRGIGEVAQERREIDEAPRHHMDHFAFALHGAFALDEARAHDNRAETLECLAP